MHIPLLGDIIRVALAHTPMHINRGSSAFAHCSASMDPNFTHILSLPGLAKTLERAPEILLKV